MDDDEDNFVEQLRTLMEDSAPINGNDDDEDGQENEEDEATTESAAVDVCCR